ncbi:hypothetical protein VQ02_08215 [Methylobacterium variabile]|jgi:hypothetical protein|uniref:Uncharacterized protein n=1 Tax=Methylobacterium variabile TaxID=298794 RepID=A0A0J6VM53_9HYPH|nr:hypothetical protein [Methylobacterium variabile]KMO40251.1 hypothetical protein VQ02_08215 [Methylobacterium variabile]
MSRLKYFVGAVMAMLVGAPEGSEAATSQSTDPTAAAPDPKLSDAAREIVAQNMQRRVIKSNGQSKYYFARESGPSWVNSPRKIDKLNNIKTLPQMQQRYR